MDITYRPRNFRDNDFLVSVSMKTMEKIIKESAGHPLTEAMVLEQIDGNQITTMIENNKRPVGFYSYTILPTGQLYVSAVVLSPKAQHQGIGRLVAKHIEQEARDNKATAIIGHIHYANNQSLIFSLKNGFRIVGPHMPGTLAVEKKLH